MKHYVCITHAYVCLLPGELSEDMETSSETTTGPLETTKDTCNLGAKQISEDTGTSAFNTFYKIHLK